MNTIKTNAAGKEIAKAIGTTVAAVLVARIAEVGVTKTFNAVSGFFAKRKAAKKSPIIHAA